MILTVRDLENIRLALEVTSNYTEIQEDRKQELFELKKKLSKFNLMDVEFEEILHPTEQKYPEQTEMFREVTEKMYKIFLDKNKDYSKYNILATGMVGIMTRFWDKTARLMHILGFDIGTGNYTGEIKATNETIEDSFYDSANYSVIALIYRAGKWGK